MTPDQIIRHILKNHGCNRIDIRVAKRNCFAYAVPAFNHPLAQERFAKAVAANPEGVVIGTRQSDEVMKQAVEPIAVGSGLTLAAALEQLLTVLKDKREAA